MHRVRGLVLGRVCVRERDFLAKDVCLLEFVYLFMYARECV